MALGPGFSGGYPLLSGSPGHKFFVCQGGCITQSSACPLLSAAQATFWATSSRQTYSFSLTAAKVSHPPPKCFLYERVLSEICLALTSWPPLGNLPGQTQLGSLAVASLIIGAIQSRSREERRRTDGGAQRLPFANWSSLPSAARPCHHIALGQCPFSGRVLPLPPPATGRIFWNAACLHHKRTKKPVQTGEDSTETSHCSLSLLSTEVCPYVAITITLTFARWEDSQLHWCDQVHTCVGDVPDCHRIVN